MAQFTLDDIRDAAEKKYGSTDIQISDTETVRLLNPLRLAKPVREELIALSEKLSDKDSDVEEDVDQEEIIDHILMLVAENETAGRKLLDVLADDLALKATIFDAYNGGVELGEASASQG